MANLVGKVLSAGEKALNKEWKTALRKSGLGKSLTKSGASASERNTILKNIKSSFDAEEDLGSVYNSLKDIGSVLNGGKVAPENLNSVSNFGSAFKGTSLEGKFNSSLSKLQRAKDAEVEAAGKTREILNSVSTSIDDYHPANKIASNKPLNPQQVSQSSEKVAHSKIGKTLTEDMGMSRDEAAQYIREARSKNPSAVKSSKKAANTEKGPNVDNDWLDDGYNAEKELGGMRSGYDQNATPKASSRDMGVTQKEIDSLKGETNINKIRKENKEYRRKAAREKANKEGNRSWYDDEESRAFAQTRNKEEIQELNTGWKNSQRDFREKIAKAKKEGKDQDFIDSIREDRIKAYKDFREQRTSLKSSNATDPTMMDWVRGHGYDKAAAGIGALGFAGSVAFGGAKSNADLYSNPF